MKSGAVSCPGTGPQQIQVLNLQPPVILAYIVPRMPQNRATEDSNAATGTAPALSRLCGRPVFIGAGGQMGLAPPHLKKMQKIFKTR
jgi:hypothetical protein